MRALVLVAMALLTLEMSGRCEPSWKLWNGYSARFIDAQGRVIDHQVGDRTTSEGQSYGMFFALVNGDRKQFDAILSWTQNNMAAGSLAEHLPGWLWGKAEDGQWKSLDANPASDADCWMAYSLLEAGRLWQSPAYTAQGRGMLRQIATREVAELPGFGKMLLPGPAAAFVHKDAWMVNPSYLPLFLVQRFAAIDPAGPWRAVGANVPRLLQQSARGGFAMDWLEYVPGSGFRPVAGPNPEQPGKTAPQPYGSYDAIRVYLWAGMVNGAGTMRKELLADVPGMAQYLAEKGNPPEKVSDQGKPLEQDGPVGFSAAVLPYLQAIPGFEKAAAHQQARLAGELDGATGLYGKSMTYYDQNLALFGTGFVGGRFAFGPRGELKVEWTRS